MQTIIRCTLLTALITVAGFVQAGQQFDPAARAKTIAPFIDEQAVVVAHVDLSRVEVDPLVDKLVELVPEAKPHQEEGRAQMRRFREAFLQAGGKELYAVVSLADVPQEPPFFIMPLGEVANEQALAELFPAHDFKVRQRLGKVFFAGGQRASERLRKLKPDARPELARAFEAAGDTTSQVLLLPPAYSRRVIEEMMPKLPEEVGGGPSMILTRGLLWAAVGANAPPDISLQVVIQSKDEQAATALRDKWVEARRLLCQRKELRESLRKFEQAFAVLTPKVDGDRLTLTLDEQNRGINALLAALTPPIEAARIAARRAQSSNNLKQIGIAMHNWYNTHKSLPAQANFDANGKPLLSWRVHILPYLAAQELYKQFHLDEPWDSEHNRKLIEKMPAVYRSPGSKLKEKGRASYLLPIGDQTAFPGRRGVEFKEIKDGVSNTIMVVEVSDQHAVIWTKPEDLPFDPQHPAKGLGGLYEGGFNAAFCDGSVRWIAGSIDPKTLHGLFTRAGGEVIEAEF